MLMALLAVAGLALGDEKLNYYDRNLVEIHRTWVPMKFDYVDRATICPVYLEHF